MNACLLPPAFAAAATFVYAQQTTSPRASRKKGNRSTKEKCRAFFFLLVLLGPVGFEDRLVPVQYLSVRVREQSVGRALVPFTLHTHVLLLISSDPTWSLTDAGVSQSLSLRCSRSGSAVPTCVGGKI